MNAPEKAVPKPSPAQAPYWLNTLVGTLLALAGGVVTTFFGLFLGFYVVGRIGGARPAPELTNLLVVWAMFGGLPLAAGIGFLGSPDSRRLWWRMLAVMSQLSVAAAVDGNLGPTNWHRAFGREKLPGTDASKLQRTMVSPHLEVPIAPGKNVLWCGTFQLAWNEACRLTGGDLQFNQADPMITALNKHTFTRQSLDEASYVALAGFVKDNIHSKIQAAVDAKFHGTFKPRFMPERGLTRRTQDFVAYSCLYKQLTFPVAFERLDDSLTFGGLRVPAFGLGTFKPRLEKAYQQVSILDYQGDDDFVIELKTRSEGDRLILAKTQPKHSLSETVTSIQSRIAAAHSQPASTNDLLVVPRVKFDLTREYSEIEGLLLISTSKNIAKDLRLLSAVQNTRFEMSEKGVELRSEAHMAFACAAEERPAVRHKMIFDKPFLLMMQRTNATMPYFALWVDNPELLVSWK